MGDYIQHRPGTDAEQLFVGQTALRGRPLSSCAIAAIIDRAYRRCGFLGWFGTHRLRPTFATRLHAHGATTKELGPHFQRARPHLFTIAEIRLILRRTRRRETRRSPLHPLTYHTLIGLLACTAKRPGEALRVQLRDFDANQGELRVRRCKFSPERTIPLHSTTVRALQHYRERRQAHFPWGDTFFVGATGRPLMTRRTERVFLRLTSDLVPRGERRSLRLLDFRHAFASQRIS